MAQQARDLANAGRLAEALAACDLWIAADKVDPAAHYLRAVVQLELGGLAQADQSLQHAVFVAPDFVLAHFALGNLARRRGRPEDAARHFANAQALLARLRPGDLLPEGEGLSAGRLGQTITMLLDVQPTP